MRYRPLPSVTALLTFSIRTSLAASTVTPGSTAPEVSLATPAIDDWACATPGARINMTHSSNFHAFLRMYTISPEKVRIAPAFPAPHPAGGLHEPAEAACLYAHRINKVNEGN